MATTVWKNYDNSQSIWGQKTIFDHAITMTTHTSNSTSNSTVTSSEFEWNCHLGQPPFLVPQATNTNTNGVKFGSTTLTNVTTPPTKTSHATKPPHRLSKKHRPQSTDAFTPRPNLSPSQSSSTPTSPTTQSSPKQHRPRKLFRDGSHRIALLSNNSNQSYNSSVLGVSGIAKKQRCGLCTRPIDSAGKCTRCT
eukprot:m.227908 g.227908  ORF g.227908 m.227908 type:complete len:194 (-) comp33532_c0_seq1:114-695(-)